MVFRVLGPIEVEVDGVARELGGPVPRRMLAALATGSGSAVEDSVLAELVWGAGLTDEVKNMMRVVVHRLRTALGPEGRAVIERTARGYRLTAPCDDELFATQVGTGLRLLADGDPGAAADQLTGARELWRGEPWAELEDTLQVSGLRIRLAELHDVAVEELQAARLASGDTTQAVAELSEAVIETPFRERRWELLALGLYRTGRQAQALDELRRVRSLFVDELGVEPGPALRELERRILEHDPGLLLVRAPVPSAPADPAVMPATVPRPSTRFIGRRAESSLLTALLAESHLVTVTGPAGVGKTRFVLEHAADRPDTWLVRLADVHDPTAVVPAIAAALGLTQSTGELMAAVQRVIGDRSAVLILDNCDHLVEHLDFVLPLLGRCPRLRILTTSRRPTGIEGERVLPLRPLPIDGEESGAVELFLDRARAHRADWQPTPADRKAARTVCEVLDGLPLAIELAAARAHSIGLTDLAERLGERLDILGATPSGSISPHPSLAAAIGWSIDQLPEVDRSLLLRLWPFDGGFDWHAAEFVRDPGTGAAVFASLATLVDRSVLTADVSSGRARYRLLETIRRHCRELDPDPAGSLAAHANWVRGLIADQVALLAGPRLPEAMRTLALELPNLRVAIAHDLEHAPLQALRSTGALTYLWVTAGVATEGMRLLRSALTACPSAPAADRARALIGLSLASAQIGAAREALAHADEAMALLDDSDPDHELLLLEAHLRRCNALADLGDGLALRAAATAFATACDRRDAPPYLQAAALWGMGIVEFQDGRHDAAATTLTRAHEISVRGGFTSGAGITDLLLAWCLLADPDSGEPVLHRALRLLRRALNSFRQQPNFSEELAALLAGAFALSRLGHRDSANRLHAAVLAHADRLGIDPARYVGFAGPEFVDRVRKAFAPVEASALPWPDMIALFTAMTGLPDPTEL
ncbi:BTAD domain-containing putative transcriptional regulator [Nocardia sp. NPDC059240]|uniref:BTAD domain-containing putative transcriptional regulator n=1 Tax=Nocardia sp. NPDC059240 TaxID=3346786 RepID=UPI003673B2EC